jgi:chemotaxis protein MotB
MPPVHSRATIPGWEENAGWLVSFGDLMLVLLCMFVLVMTIGRRENAARVDAPVVDAEAVAPERTAYFEVEPVAGRTAAGRETRALLDTMLAEAERDAPREYRPVDLGDGPAAPVQTAVRRLFEGTDAVEIESSPDTVVVRLHESISFASGSAELLPDVGPLLDGLTRLLLEHPGIRVETSGHTDDVPIHNAHYPSNWELSAARAAAVARRLLGGAVLDPLRITVAGYAEHRPVAAGHSPEARARNRRVEIRLVNLPKPDPPA